MDLVAFKEHVHGFAQSNILSIPQLKRNFLLGLYGETGELVDLYKKHLYHGDALDPNKVRLEVGDILWYLYAVGDIFEIDFVMTDSRPDMIELSEKYSFELLFKLRRCSNFILDALSTNTKPSTNASYFMTDCLAQIISPLRFTLEDCMQANYDKLTARHGGTAFNREVMRVNKPLEE